MKRLLDPGEIFFCMKCLFVCWTVIFGSVCTAAEATVLPVHPCKKDPLASPGLSGFELRSVQTVNARNCSAFDGQRSSSGDPSYARFVFNADHENIYFGAEVHDSVVHVTQPMCFQNDGFEIFFDTRNAGASGAYPTPYFYQIVLNPSDGTEPARKVVYRNPHVAFLSTYIRVVSERTPDGYFIKAVIPRKGLNGLDPAGMLPGVGVAWLNAAPDRFQRLWWKGREFRRLPELNAYLAFPESDTAKLLVKAKDAAAKARKKTVEENVERKNTAGPHRGAPVVNACRIVSEKLEKCAVIEGVIEGRAEYRNPFDYQDVQFQVEITAPDGKHEVIDAFFDRKFIIKNLPYWTEFENPGTEAWRWRYLPRLAGTYRMRARATDSAGRRSESPETSFTVADSRRPGIVRVSPNDSRYLRHETGEFFFSTGYPIHFWRNYRERLDLMIRMHMNQLKAYGCNTTSIMIQDLGNNGLSLGGQLKRDYNMESAARLDNLFRYASRRGVYVIINLLFTTWGYDGETWARNEFNIKNGGPCRDVSEFFTKKEPVEAVQNRLRYLIARYGAYPNVLCWEVFNEIELTAFYRQSPDKALNYIEKMARFIKKHDIYRHMVSSSCNMEGRLQKSSVIDALLPHHYPMDVGETLCFALLNDSQWKKPQFGGEVGVGHVQQGYLKVAEADSDAVPLRNSLYASLFGTAAGTILHWWDYYHLRDQFEEFTKFNRFISGMELDREHFTPGNPAVRYGNSADAVSSFEFPFNELYHHPRPHNEYQCMYHFRNGRFCQQIGSPKREVNDSDRMFAMVGNFPRYFFSRDVHKGYMPWRFYLTIPASAPGKLILQPRSVGARGTVFEVRHRDGNRLIVREKIFSRSGNRMPDPDVEDPTLSPIVIPLEVGENKLVFQNVGNDFLTVQKVVARDLYDPLKAGNPNLYCHVLTGESHTLVYLRHAQSNWQDLLNGVRLPVTKNAKVDVPVRGNEPYRVRFYETMQGEFSSPEIHTPENGIISLTLPPFTRDIAVRLERMVGNK